MERRLLSLFLQDRGTSSEWLYTMDRTLASSEWSGSVLGLIDDPITKELEESQSKLIRVRWTGFVAGEYESSLCVCKNDLITVNLLNWQQIAKAVTDRGPVIDHVGVPLFLSITILKQLIDLVLQNFIEAIIVELVLFLLNECLT